MEKSPHSKWVEEMSDFAQELRDTGFVLEASEHVERAEKVSLVDCDSIDYALFHRNVDNEVNAEGLSHDALKAEVLADYLKNDLRVPETELVKQKENLHKLYSQINNTSFQQCLGQQFIFLDNKEQDIGVTGKIMFSGVSKELQDKMAASGLDLYSVSKKRGFYHEATHTVGTEDEKKCDAFAALKVLQDCKDINAVDFLSNARMNGMMYPIGCVREAVREGNQAEGDRWRSYLMPRTLVMIKEKGEELLATPDFDRMSNEQLLASAVDISEKSGYSAEEMKRLDDVLIKPLTFETVKDAPVFSDLLTLSGCQTDQDKKVFLEDRLIYEGMFRQIIGGGKNVERDVLNNPENRKKAEKIMSEWGMDKAYQKEFLTRNMPPKASVPEKVKAAEALAEKSFVALEISRLKKEQPDLSPKQLQASVAHALVDYNWSRISEVGKTYQKNPSLYFDQTYIAESAAKVSQNRSSCAKAAGLAGEYIQAYEKGSLHSQLTKGSVAGQDKLSLMDKLKAFEGVDKSSQKTTVSKPPSKTVQAVAAQKSRRR